MPRVFDNIDLPLLPALRETLKLSYRADFCVGYFNLRGWQKIDDLIEQYLGAPGACCRLLVGMQSRPIDILREAFTLSHRNGGIDKSTIALLKKRIAGEFREQLMMGAPTNQDEAGLRRLSKQIKSKKLIVKLFLAYPLHAKLYLIHRQDPNSPIVGFLGSSNLTFAGLQKQGELNIDVLDHDACNKLQKWFDDRWHDFGCVDISKELAEIIDQSWARETLIPPYYIYLKIAYHLSHEAIAGVSQFRIPREFSNLFDFQKAAVQLAARHVTKRGGVIVGDVVGLGKTLIGTAIVKILQEDLLLETLIICPKNLVKMWQEYVDNYRIYAKILSISQVQNQLPELRRYRVVLIDESHNLRNRNGKRYRAIQEYIAMNESKCILLSATPYNKTYLDLSSQLRLFVPEDQDLGLRPEALLNELGGSTIGEIKFHQLHQCSIRSLAAFEKSEKSDDWRELMKRYMVRRTRSFIKDNYAKTDNKTGRKYLEFADSSCSYFPDRVPVAIKFSMENSSSDAYSWLYSDEVFNAINRLNLPRYGLGNYIPKKQKNSPTEAEQRQLKDLSNAGRRLMGFSRTNLFKRLESSGMAFIQSLERHILRNFVYLYAIENNLEIPIGTQNADLLDTRNSDEDSDSVVATEFDTEIEEGDDTDLEPEDPSLRSEKTFRERAKVVYQEYQTRNKRRFKWLRSTLFDTKKLKGDLLSDAQTLIQVLENSRKWETQQDEKLGALVELLTKTHPHEKVLIFTQFADTVRYLTDNLQGNIASVAGVTGQSQDPTEIAGRFSPVSNGKRDKIPPEKELRILIATDVLSEGHNLQDCAIIVNYDLPWAIIRLIQRAGRVDRIGQKADKILCYSFLPAEGVERIINLRARLRQRLQENAEVVGTDERFFEDEQSHALLDLYNEKSGALDDDEDTEVDLTSEAFQIWKKATENNPTLKKMIEEMPNVVYSTRPHIPTPVVPEGVLLYMKTAEGNDSLILVDRQGNSVTQSQLGVLRAAVCEESTPAIPRDEQHHELVSKGAELLALEETNSGGQLGRQSGARFRTYERLKRYANETEGNLSVTEEVLKKAIDEIYQNPLRQSAIDTLNRQLKSGINDQQLAELVIALRRDDRLCIISEEAEKQEPVIICSLGLFKEK